MAARAGVLLRSLGRRAERRLLCRDWAVVDAIWHDNNANSGDATTFDESDSPDACSPDNCSDSAVSDKNGAGALHSVAVGPDFLHRDVRFVHRAGRGISVVASADIPAGALLIREACYAAALARLPRHVCDELFKNPATRMHASTPLSADAVISKDVLLRQLSTGGLALLSPRLFELPSIARDGYISPLGSGGDDDPAAAAAAAALASLVVRNPPSTEAAWTALTSSSGPVAASMLLPSMSSPPSSLLQHVSEVCARNATYAVNVDGIGSNEHAARLPIKRSLLNHACRANAATLHAPLTTIVMATGDNNNNNSGVAVCYVRAVRDVSAGASCVAFLRLCLARVVVRRCSCWRVVGGSCGGGGGGDDDDDDGGGGGGGGDDDSWCVLACEWAGEEISVEYIAGAKLLEPTEVRACAG